MGNLPEISSSLAELAKELKPPIVDFATWASIALSGVTLYLAWLATKLSREAVETDARSERQSRALSAQLDCQQRYAALESKRLLWRYGTDEDRCELSKSNHVGMFFRNFWTLKSDQFELWLAGNIEYHTFIGWTASTLRHFRQSLKQGIDDGFFIYSFTAGWAHYGRPYHLELNPLFVRLHDALYYYAKKFGQDTSDIDIIDDLLEEIDKANVTDGKNRRLGYIETPAGYRSYRKFLRKQLPKMFNQFFPQDYDPERLTEALKQLHPRAVWVGVDR